MSVMTPTTPTTPRPLPLYSSSATSFFGTSAPPSARSQQQPLRSSNVGSPLPSSTSSAGREQVPMFSPSFFDGSVSASTLVATPTSAAKDATANWKRFVQGEHTLVYVVDLSLYDQVLEEDPVGGAIAYMEEGFSAPSSQDFNALVLLLKIDHFAAKFAATPVEQLKTQFPDFVPPKNGAAVGKPDARGYIVTRFRKELLGLDRTGIRAVHWQEVTDDEQERTVINAFSKFNPRF
ncbi:hypothetical protein MKEN_00642500 [Mycena kentingensis (nom. inval.)]|nr:hypothetical protein MKEN_00642500 [Mycena kentingensis (nom. inval.)]